MAIPYYQDSTVTIYHGDCREILPGVLDMANETGTTHLTPRVLVTDPPYGLRLGRMLWPSKRMSLRKVSWDDQVFDGLEAIAALMPACVWGGNHYVLPPSRGWLVWYKPDAPPSMAACELAWTSLNRPARHITHAIAATNYERVAHPTQKPLRVMSWCIDGMPAGVIIDPFCGSGTTLRAAKDLGRKAIGIEIEERYCEIAARRCAQEVLEFDGDSL